MSLLSQDSKKQPKMQGFKRIHVDAWYLMINGEMWGTNRTHSEVGPGGVVKLNSTLWRSEVYGVFVVLKWCIYSYFCWLQASAKNQSKLTRGQTTVWTEVHGKCSAEATEAGLRSVFIAFGKSIDITLLLLSSYISLSTNNQYLISQLHQNTILTTNWLA